MFLLSFVGGRLPMENLEVEQSIELTIQKYKPELKQQKLPLFNHKKIRLLSEVSRSCLIKVLLTN
jgi:hypothetical protein